MGLVALVSLFAALIACGAPVPPEDRRPDMLVVTLDTTRADALGAYGQSPSPSPTLDQLASEGALAQEAMTVTPLTLPAHSSIFTGLYPDRHGVRDNNHFALGAGPQTLAEALKGAGWRTGAFIAAVVLDSTFGLDRGFEVYNDGFDLTDPDTHKELVAHWDGAEVGARARAWLSEVAMEPAPVFAWAHFYDAHQPLTPDPTHAALFPDDPYLAEIAGVDEQVRMLVDHWRSLNRGRGLLIAVVGDHGEGRGDHGEITHGLFVYRSTMRVPFLLHGPGVPPGAALPGLVSVVDLAPTLLELAGVEGLEGVDGRSLVPALRGQPLEERPAYGESFHGRYQFGFSELRVLQTAEERYIRAPDPELYRWRVDPGELENLAGDAPALAAGEASLAGFLEGRVVAEGLQSGVDEATLALLESLGYVGGASLDADIPWSELPDPKSQPDMVTLFMTVVFSARSRPPAQGIPILRTFLERYPRVDAARELLARALLLDGDLDGARSELSSMLERRPDDPALLSRMAEVELAGAGGDPAKLAAARALAERALAKKPQAPAVQAVLGEILRQLGDCEGAIAAAEAGLAYAPDANRLLLVRGACLEQLGRLPEAEVDLTRVLALDPENVDAHFLLGMTLARQGRPDEALPHFEAQVALSPEASLAQAGLGMALYALGRFEEAIAPLRLAAPDPEAGDEPPLLLADALLRTGGDLDEVAAMLALAEARAPDNPAIHGVRAQLLMSLGDIDGALEAVRASKGGP
jgi:arylsulfatase A-like enzyme/tetratricopeptide (TPR) repeat protein